MSTDKALAKPEEEITDAYALLSRPTLEYTDDEIKLVIKELRRRRDLFLASGKVDRPKAEKKAAVKLSADEKARNSAALLAQLKIPGMGS